MAHIRFWMRYTCCSNLRQGSMRQASLEGSAVSGFSFSAFLSAIVLVHYLPYSSAYVCISPGFPRSIGFLGNRPTVCIGWYLLIASTSNGSNTVVPPFHLFVLRFFQIGCYPPDTLLNGRKWMPDHFPCVAVNRNQPPGCHYLFGQA